MGFTILYHLKLNSVGKFSGNLPISRDNLFTPELYIITPTYSRPTQKADLLRVAHSLILSNFKIFWIIVEDTNNIQNSSSLLINFRDKVQKLSSSRVQVVLLRQATAIEAKHQPGDLWRKYPRGVNQRN